MYLRPVGDRAHTVAAHGKGAPYSGAQMTGQHRNRAAEAVHLIFQVLPPAACGDFHAVPVQHLQGGVSGSIDQHKAAFAQRVAHARMPGAAYGHRNAARPPSQRGPRLA